MCWGHKSLPSGPSPRDFERSSFEIEWGDTQLLVPEARASRYWGRHAAMLCMSSSSPLRARAIPHVVSSNTPPKVEKARKQDLAAIPRHPRPPRTTAQAIRPTLRPCVGRRSPSSGLVALGLPIRCWWQQYQTRAARSCCRCSVGYGSAIRLVVRAPAGLLLRPRSPETDCCAHTREREEERYSID